MGTKERVLTDAEITLPKLIGTLAELHENTQKVIKAYGEACYRTALQSEQVQKWKRDSERFHKIDLQRLVYYDYRRIGWELEQTAMGEGFYGHALSVARDVPGLSEKEPAVIDRYATGTHLDIDHVALQEIALKMYKISEPIDF